MIIGGLIEKRLLKIAATTPKGEKITDEVCACGHTRSMHLDVFIGSTLIGVGHGLCEISTCNCQQFTFHGFLFNTCP